MPLLTPQYDFHRIEEIPTDFFIRHGIRALLLDVDNTLTGDNSQEIKPEVMDWLERQRAAGLRLFVISNNHELRVAPFANRLGLGYIADAAKPKKKVALAKMKEFGVSPRPAFHRYPVWEPVRLRHHSGGALRRRRLRPVPHQASAGKTAAAPLPPPQKEECRMIRIGPAGNSESFTAMGYKSTPQIPEYLEKMGLNAYEYQCGRGVRINREGVLKLKAGCEARDIQLSLHAPYYISLSSVEEEKRQNSIKYILESAEAADLMGARRIVVHSGSCAKISREEALSLAGETLKQALAALDEAHLGHIIVCPEVMGKFNQLGTLEEVMELCKLDDRLLPCIDFGHLNARTLGSIRGAEDYERILLTMKNEIGEQRMKCFHSHFSQIEYTENGGEKRHLTFADTTYGPYFAPLAEVLVKYDSQPTIICESAGTQAEDAATMRDLYNQAAERKNRA